MDGLTEEEKFMFNPLPEDGTGVGVATTGGDEETAFAAVLRPEDGGVAVAVLNWKEYESAEPIDTYGVVVIIWVSMGGFFGGRPRFLRGRTVGSGVERLEGGLTRQDQYERYERNLRVFRHCVRQ